MASTEVVMFAFFYELFGGVFLAIISYFLVKRYLEWRTNASLYLALAIISVGAGILISSFGRLAALLEGITPYYHGYQYTPFVWIALGLVLNVIGDIFILLFANHVFYEGNKRFSIIFIVIGVIIAGALLFFVPTPEINAITHEPSAFYISSFQLVWLCNALFTFFTGGLVTYSAIKSSRKDRSKVEKRGLQLIALLGIGLALTNIMFIIDEQLTPYFGGDFSIFYYLAWIFAHLGVLCAYLGFILPNWLRKRWD